MISRLLGNSAERQAEKHLRQAGFQLLERNFTTRFGEIDLIMQNEDLVIFVEVRMRTNKLFGSGAESVTQQKQQKIIRTSQQFLQTHLLKGNESFRFDVVSISADGIDWIPDAFNLD